MRADDQDKSAPAPPAVRKVAEKQFLACEFVTWLYFTLIEEGAQIPLHAIFSVDTAEEDAIVRFAIGKRAQLRTLDATGVRVALSGADLDDNGEILQAVRRGAFIDVLSLHVSIQSRVYAFTLRADDGGLVAVKLPDLFSELDAHSEHDAPGERGEDGGVIEDPLAPKTKRKRRPKLPLEDILALRMQCLAELEKIIDTMFERFVTRRLARAWHTEDVAGIRQKVAAGLRSRLVHL